MNLDAFIQKFDTLITTLETQLPQQMQIAAFDGMALLEQRLLEKGTQASGVNWRDYDPFYREFKKAKGKYTGFVNFKFTGDMLSSLGIIDKKNANNNITVKVGARDEFSKEKLERNNALRPGLLDLSKKESKDVQAAFSKRVQKIVKTVFQ